MTIFIVLICAIIALGFGAASAWSDFRHLIIPNLYSIFIVATFVPAFLAVTFLAPESTYFDTWKSHILAAVMIFIITYALFFFKLFGGGDAKLLSALALWVGLSGLIPLLFAMAMMGAVLSISTLALRQWKPVKNPTKDSWIEKAQNGENKVPYGVAIFVGAVTSFWQIGYLQPEIISTLASSAGGQ